MQTVTPAFTTRAAGNMRKITSAVKIAWEKQLDEDVTFFILDTSVLDGPDILSPNTGYDNVVRLWDMYSYSDYSDRIISLEWQREELLPFSINRAIADVVLDNHDDYFSPGGGSAIAEFILPRRPIRILAGFGNENVPVFVGLTEKMPEFDESNKTVKLHCIDFLAYLFEKPLTESVMYIDKRTDEVLDELFQMFGLSSSQYVLDVGFNIIPFAYFEKDMKLGGAIEELMEAEVGALYMDETGIIRFKNKQARSLTPVYEFDEDNVVDISAPNQSDIINVVEAKVNARSVQNHQPVYQLGQSFTITPGQTVEVWADFQDPVISITEPTLGYRENSYFRAYRGQDTDSEEVLELVDLVSTYLFATSYKMQIKNNGATTVFINEMELYGEPAKVTTVINERFEDEASVAKFEEQGMTIDNNLIQSHAQASSAGQTILQHFSEYGDVLEARVKGSMALQIGDAVTFDARSYSGTFLLIKLACRIIGGGFTQIVKAKKNWALTYFFLDTSLLDSEDRLSP